MLMENENWLGDALNRFAETSGVVDLEAFQACVSDTARVAVIEGDIAAVRDLGGRGTPTLIVNGVHLGKTPIAAELEEIVAEALRTNAADGGRGH